MRRPRIVLTDEPFNVEIGGHVTGGDHREFVMASGEMTDSQLLDFNQKWMDAVLPHLVDGGVLGTFIDWRGLPIAHAAATGLGLTPLNLVVWAKTNAGMGKSLTASQHSVRNPCCRVKPRRGIFGKLVQQAAEQVAERRCRGALAGALETLTVRWRRRFAPLLLVRLVKTNGALGCAIMVFLTAHQWRNGAQNALACPQGGTPTHPAGNRGPCKPHLRGNRFGVWRRSRAGYPPPERVAAFAWRLRCSATPIASVSNRIKRCRSISMDGVV